MLIYFAMNKTKLGGILGTTGLIIGLAYGIKHSKGFGMTALFAGLGGVAGVLIGNQVTKFYE